MAFRSVGAAVHETNMGAVALVMNAPAGYQVGDVLIAFISEDHTAVDAGNITFTGWTLLGEINVTNDGQNALIYWKVAAGGDNFTVSTTTAGTQTSGFVGAWSGRDTSPTPSVQSSQNNGSLTSPISVSLTGLTAAQGDDIAAFVTIDQEASTDTWTFSAITDYTERIEYSSSDWDSNSLQTRDNVNAGATGALATTATRGTGASNAGWGGWVVAIKAAGGGVSAAWLRA